MTGRILALGAICGIAAASTANATTYRVSENGSDHGLGTVEAPWASIQHAADRVQAGDRVMVSKGEYTGFQVTASGTVDAPIVFMAESGTQITGDNPHSNNGIDVADAGHVVIDGFTVTGATRAGISGHRCHDVTIKNNRTDQNGKWGIFSSHCDDLVIEDNETSRSQTQHGIYTSNSGDRPTIRNNYSWGNRASGIHMNGDRFYGGDGIISGALVEGNVLAGNGHGGGSAINLDGVQDSVFSNNLLYDNYATGIALFRIDGAEASRDNLIVNNTIVMPGENRWAVLIRNGSTGNRVFNNILVNPDPTKGSLSVAADSLDDFYSDYNVLSDEVSADDGATMLRLEQWQATTGHDMHSISAKPEDLFSDSAEDDFTLSKGSFAVDRGLETIAPKADIDGTSRPIGDGVDIGAFEYPAEETPKPDSSESPPTNGEDTGSDDIEDGNDDDDNSDNDATYSASDSGCAATGDTSTTGFGLVMLLGALATRPRRRFRSA